MKSKKGRKNDGQKEPTPALLWKMMLLNMMIHVLNRLVLQKKMILVSLRPTILMAMIFSF